MYHPCVRLQAQVQGLILPWGIMASQLPYSTSSPTSTLHAQVHPASPRSSPLLSCKATYKESSLFIVSLTKHFSPIQLNGLFPRSLPCCLHPTPSRKAAPPTHALQLCLWLILSFHFPHVLQQAAFVSRRDCGMRGPGLVITELPGSSILQLEFVEEKN